MFPYMGKSTSVLDCDSRRQILSMFSGQEYKDFKVLASKNII